MSRFRFYLAIALVVLFLAFVLQNLEPTRLRFLFWTRESPPALLLILAYLIGAFTGMPLLKRIRSQFSKEKTKTA